MQYFEYTREFESDFRTSSSSAAASLSSVLSVGVRVPRHTHQRRVCVCGRVGDGRGGEGVVGVVEWSTRHGSENPVICQRVHVKNTQKFISNNIKWVTCAHTDMSYAGVGVCVCVCVTVRECRRRAIAAGRGCAAHGTGISSGRQARRRDPCDVRMNAIAYKRAYIFTDIARISCLRAGQSSPGDD